MKQLTGERILAGITILLGIGAMLQAVQLGYRLNDQDMGVGLFPLIVGGCLVCCGIYHIVSAGRIPKTYQPLTNQQTRLIVSVFLALVGCVLLMEYAGYFAATFLFVAYLTKLLGEPSWYKTLLLAAVAALAFVFVFEIWMQLPLPTGFFSLQEVL
jgi:hypothetical protein